MHRPLRLMTCRTERGSSCHSLTDPSGPQTGPSLSFLRTTQDSWKFNLEREQGQGQGFGAKSTRERLSMTQTRGSVYVALEQWARMRAC